ncbi:hypothetical protein CORC01_09165 [Colletotrichum orchidophilum]|uniref:Uncharacterized protein n=1 Tax=Colletotrichum orchidophilum TaxID=1209926 RepID=A0A1G4B2M6_9PEZI|nr:uncharacterized protein CORC01_09165 [Colletotrichum orchidophilum]OHE95575.1 hypothetical protein CORC01_09165 [Colletotrichum orchidophilum]
MKKKSTSTLANLAPHRRGKGNQKEEKKDTQAPIPPPLPANRSGPGHPFSNPAPGGSTDQTVDRLANDLLESTIYHHPNGLRSHPSVLLCGTEPMAMAPMISPNVPATAASAYRFVNLPSEEIAAHFKYDAQAAETNQVAPVIPERSSRRPRGERERNIDAFGDPENRPVVLTFPHSETTMLNPGNRHPLFLPASTTTPLGKKDVGAKNDTEFYLINPNLVSDKVAAMLAATEALKPPGSGNNTLSSSKTSGFRRKKVISKVRHALDIFQPKPSTPESRIRGKISAPVGLTTCELPNPAAHYHLEEVEEASPVSSIELRFNEGNNLHNHKVQSIVGGRIIRKTAPDDGRSLRSGGSPDDPSSGQVGVNRTPTPFEYHLKSSIDSTGVPPVPSLNPFDAEKDFDTDLEGILSEKPVCASTPRRPDRKAVPLDSPSKRYAKADDRYLAFMNDNEGGPSAPGPTPKKLKLSGSLRLFHDQPDLSTKKHPSPNKEDLDDLETRFREYAIQQIELSPIEEQPALRIKFAGLIGPAALGPKDKNTTLMSGEAKQRATKPSVVGEASTVSLRQYTREEFTQITTSRIPRPAPRYTSYNRPSNSDALDIDELQ